MAGAVWVFLARQPDAAVLIVAAMIVTAVILVEPFVGVPIMILLGTVGELQHFAGGLSLAKGLTAVLAVALLAQLAAGKLTLRRTGLEIPILSFTFVYCALSVRNIGVALETSWDNIVTMLGYPLAFLIFLNLVRTGRQVRWSVVTLGIGATLGSLAAILQYFLGFSILYAVKGTRPSDTNPVLAGWLRAKGLVYSPNVNAYAALLVIPLLIALVFATRRSWVKVVIIAATAASTLGLGITFSRGGYVGLALGLLWLLLRLRESLRLVAILALLIILLLSFVPSNVLSARFQYIPAQIGGGSDRLLQYYAGLHVFTASPLFGPGASEYEREVTRRTRDPVSDLHSNVLSVVVNSGLVGLALLIWLIISYCGFMYRGLASMMWSPLKYCAVGTLGGLIAFLAQGFFITNMGWFLMWAMLALPPCCVLADRECARCHHRLCRFGGFRTRCKPFTNCGQPRMRRVARCGSAAVHTAGVAPGTASLSTRAGCTTSHRPH